MTSFCKLFIAEFAEGQRNKLGPPISYVKAAVNRHSFFPPPVMVKYAIKFVSNKKKIAMLLNSWTPEAFPVE